MSFMLKASFGPYVYGPDSGEVCNTSHFRREKMKLHFFKMPAYVPAGQKRAPDLITDGCEPLCGGWELNSGSLEEQSVLLISEPPLQPQVQFCKQKL